LHFIRESRHVQPLSCGYDAVMETVTRHVQLALTADALWAAITDRDTLEAWLGERVDVDLRPGGAGVIIDNGVARDVVVQSVDEGRGWTFEWRVDNAPVSTVSFEIATAEGGDSVLTITETLEGAGAQAQASVSSFRWELCALLLWACTAAVALVR
jgi:uncharacterized protein YndB with AHSA1/START domain